MTVVPFKREPPAKPTFVCIDCGFDVYSFPSGAAPEPARCLTCRWIADIVDPVERETLRRWYREQK